MFLKKVDIILFLSRTYEKTSVFKYSYKALAVCQVLGHLKPIFVDTQGRILTYFKGKNSLMTVEMSCDYIIQSNSKLSICPLKEGIHVVK